MDEGLQYHPKLFLLWVGIAALLSRIWKNGKESPVRLHHAQYAHGLIPAALFLGSWTLTSGGHIWLPIALLLAGVCSACVIHTRARRSNYHFHDKPLRRPIGRHLISCALVLINQVIGELCENAFTDRVFCSIIAGTSFFISLMLLQEYYNLTFRAIAIHLPLLSWAVLLLTRGTMQAIQLWQGALWCVLGAGLGSLISTLPTDFLSALDVSGIYTAVTLILAAVRHPEMWHETLWDLVVIVLCLGIGRYEYEAFERSPSPKIRLMDNSWDKMAIIDEEDVKTYSAKTTVHLSILALAAWTLIQLAGFLPFWSDGTGIPGRHDLSLPFDQNLANTPWAPEPMKWPQIEYGSLFKHTPGATPEQEGTFPRKVGLLAIPAGIKAKENVDKIVRVMEPHGLDVMIFHYDDADWSDLEWYARAHSVRVKGVAKLWFAKRFLTKEIVSNYDYIFLWDDDVYFEEGHFDAKRLISNLYKYNIQVAQPAVKNSDWWEIWPTGNKIGRWVDFVETMCPIYSTKAWISCIQPSIQYHLSTGCGFDLSVFYPCAALGYCRTAILEQDRMVHLNQQSMTGSNKHDDGWSDMCINDLREGRIFEKAWCEQDLLNRPCRNGTTYTSFRKIHEFDAKTLDCPAHQDRWPAALPVKWK